jgi:hypothetical protein
MKALVFGVTAATIVGITGVIPTAQARDATGTVLPRAQQLAAGPSTQLIASEVQAMPAATPRYVWKEGYVHGKWRESWVPVK